MAQYHRALQPQADASTQAGMPFWFDGTALTWVRDGWALSWAGERQTLPSGSTPLQVNGGPPICGQGWTEFEVQAFRAITSASVVYEYQVSEDFVLPG